MPNLTSGIEWHRIPNAPFPSWRTSMTDGYHMDIVRRRTGTFTLYVGYNEQGILKISGIVTLPLAKKIAASILALVKQQLNRTTE